MLLIVMRCFVAMLCQQARAVQSALAGQADMCLMASRPRCRLLLPTTRCTSCPALTNTTVGRVEMLKLSANSCKSKVCTFSVQHGCKLCRSLHTSRLVAHHCVLYIHFAEHHLQKQHPVSSSWQDQQVLPCGLCSYVSCDLKR
jgi:hypothetical protein